MLFRVGILLLSKIAEMRILNSFKRALNVSGNSIETVRSEEVSKLFSFFLIKLKTTLPLFDFVDCKTQS